MANTLTSLIPSLYESVDVVSRELVGLIPAVTPDFSAARAAVGQSVISFVTPQSTASDITPGVTAPNDGDQNIGSINWTITKARAVPVRWNGEESRGLNNGGPGRRTIMVQQFAQAMRTLVNECEADGTALAIHSSRAYGTSGVTPFATTVAASALVRKILDDNGAPSTERSLIIDTSAGANLRTLANLTKANEAGTTDILRQGTLIDLHGFAIRESAKIITPTIGTSASSTTSASALTVGQTVIPLATAGTGHVVAGDIIDIAGDTNLYVVESATYAGANPASGDTITIGEPGIRLAQGSSAKAITVHALSTRNMAFTRSAIGLATRAPAIPEEGDMADDAVLITDPKSGLTFEVRLYKQYRQVRYEIALAWGWKVFAPRHTAIVLG